MFEPSAKPPLTMTLWAIFETLDQHHHHLVGLVMQDDAPKVTSYILPNSFNPAASSVLTAQSRRVYTLQGPPGLDVIAMHLWIAWVRGYGVTGFKEVSATYWVQIQDTNRAKH